MSTHRYEAHTSWEGSTAHGYETYSRAHRVGVPPVSRLLDLSAHPAFRGDPAQLNPEQLLVVATMSCQLLSFLAVAARARVDVVQYEDRAEGVMPDDDLPARITRITLRPRIVVRGDVDESRVHHLVEVGHRQCFIANSLTAEVIIEPEIEIVGDEP